VEARREREANVRDRHAALDDSWIGVGRDAEAIEHVGRAALARERAVAVLGDDAATRRNENSGEGRHVDGARAIAAGTARVDTAIGERARERRRAAAHRRCGTDELVDALPFCTQCDEEAADLCGSRLAVHDLADDLGHLGAREVVLVEGTRDRANDSDGHLLARSRKFASRRLPAVVMIDSG